MRFTNDWLSDDRLHIDESGIQKSKAAIISLNEIETSYFGGDYPDGTG